MKTLATILATALIVGTLTWNGGDTINQAKNKLLSQANEIVTLENSINDLNSQVQDLEDQLADYDGVDIENILSQIDTLNAQIQILETEKNNLVTDYSEALTALETQVNETNRLAGELQKANNDAAELQAILDSLNNGTPTVSTNVTIDFGNCTSRDYYSNVTVSDIKSALSNNFDSVNSLGITDVKMYDTTGSNGFLYVEITSNKEIGNSNDDAMYLWAYHLQKIVNEGVINHDNPGKVSIKLTVKDISGTFASQTTIYQ